jgi:hypothetical protein
MCFTVRRTRPVIPFYRYTITSPPTILIKIERPSWGAVCARSEACRGEVGRLLIGDLWEVEGDVETGSGGYINNNNTLVRFSLVSMSRMTLPLPLFRLLYRAFHLIIPCDNQMMQRLLETWRPLSRSLTAKITLSHATNRPLATRLASDPKFPSESDGSESEGSSSCRILSLARWFTFPVLIQTDT